MDSYQTRRLGGSSGQFRGFDDQVNLGHLLPRYQAALEWRETARAILVAEEIAGDPDVLEIRRLGDGLLRFGRRLHCEAWHRFQPFLRRCTSRRAAPMGADR
jgi:hypothetical protein